MLQIPSVRIITWLVNNDICERYLKIRSGIKTGQRERALQAAGKSVVRFTKRQNIMVKGVFEFLLRE